MYINNVYMILNIYKASIYGLGGGKKEIYVAPVIDVKAIWKEYCLYNVAQHTPSL